MRDGIKVGIAGVGFIGAVHIEALRRCNIEVIGLVGSNPQQSETRARELGVEKAYPSYEAMLADPDITAVHIATPNCHHYMQAKMALLAGKHVVCEKPLATASRESAELVKLARETGRVNVVNFNLRFYPLVQQARCMVRSGELGRIYAVHGSYLQDWLLWSTDWNWRVELDRGGALRATADIGSHWLDLVTFVTGLRVEAVCADLATFLPTRRRPTRSVETFGSKLLRASEYVEEQVHTEDYAGLLVRFAEGARGVLTVSQMSAGRKNRLWFEIDGAQRSLAWDSEHPNELWVGQRDGLNGLLMKDPALLAPEARDVTAYPGGHQEGFADTFKQLYTKVYRYLRAGDFGAPPDFPTFADGHYELLVGEAVERSARERRWVAVEG